MNHLGIALSALALISATSASAQEKSNAFVGPFIGFDLIHQKSDVKRANVRTTDGVFSYD